MKDILDKISSYNLFNYLLPGVLFVVIANKTTTYTFPMDDLATGAFVAYFAGLVISRFGSVIIEPLLIKLSFVKFADYKDFVSASQKDPKVEILSEQNNTYRTLTSLFVVLVLLKVYEWIGLKLTLLRDYNSLILIALLLVLFLISYRKQTAYVVKRIKADINKE